MKPRILIVDDDEQNLTLLSIKMEREGYEVAKASNGFEAIDRVCSYKPDLIIMDVMMPGMDGYEALRRIKSNEESRYIPVIMLTGRTDVEDKIMGFEVGAEDYISKPFSLVEVAARVKSLLRMRALQNKLRDTEKMAALGEMVDGIAHDVRNPLVTIGGLARRLYEHETEETHKVYASRIIEAVERLERMLTRIDEYKRILSTTLVEGDINSVILEAVSDIREVIEGSDKSIEVKTRLMPDPPHIRLDRMNLKIAIFNILQNSFEAIERSGEISVETLPTSDGEILLRIRDTGAGMSEEDMRNVFNPFQTSKMQGAGLGLTICYRIVHDHGGDITVESEKGKGATVTMRFHPAVREGSALRVGAEGGVSES